jgi:transposase
MPTKAREAERLDRMWDRIQPLLSPKPLHPKGGRPFADDKACFAGIVYVLRNRSRWNNMPRCFPFGVTCWRRFRDWTNAGVWTAVWAVVVEEFDAAGILDTTELFLDASFAEA